MSRTIHILSGWSAAGSFRQAMHFDRDDILVEQDLLSCGPLLPLQSLTRWRLERTAYWNSIHPDEGFAFSELDRDLSSNAQTLREASTVVVWLGMSMPDQLLLAWVAELLRHVESSANLQVVQFTDWGEHKAPVWSLNLLNPNQIRMHPPAENLSRKAIDELSRCWSAVTAGCPEPLLLFLNDEQQHLPHLRKSLASILDRYPNEQTGLGRWDFELLRRTKEHGPKAARIIGYTMGYNFDADLIGDLYLFSRLRQLSAPSLPAPLIRLTGNTLAMRECEAVLTSAGESVLSGEAHAVHLNGFKDWIFGVHVDASIGGVWYRTNQGLVRAP